MRVLRSVYHFLLFLIVSWTVYNTFIFIALALLPLSDFRIAKVFVFYFWDFYLLGALDFPEFLSMLSDTLSWLKPAIICKLWFFYLYAAFVNGLAAYIWCNNQNLLSAFFLALSPCIAGPFLSMLFCDYKLLICGIIAMPVFYAILHNLNNYRKKRFPHLSLPIWLEWRKPNMVPPKKPITTKIAEEFHKFIF